MEGETEVVVVDVFIKHQTKAFQLTGAASLFAMDGPVMNILITQKMHITMLTHMHFKDKQ